MEQLKPWPFCGKDRAFVDYIINAERPAYRHCARVMCAFCHANAGSSGLCYTKEESEEKAIKAWNRRVSE